MKILRIAVGAVVAAFGLFSLFPVATDVLYKAGALAKPAGEAAGMTALWAATPWWQLGASAAVAALFLAIGWRLVRRRPALGLYVAALVADAVLWWIMHSAAAYQQVFTPTEVQIDYDIVLAVAVAGALIWWVERRPMGEAASA